MITATELHRLFNLIHDEVDSDYFGVSQRDDWLTLAQLHIFKHFYDSDGLIQTKGHEETRKYGQYISPFLVEATASNSTGLVNHSDISSDPLHAVPVFVCGYNTLGGRKNVCRPITKAEHARQNNMPFYTPVNYNPVVVILNDSYQIYPIEGTMTWEATAYRIPPAIDLNQGIGSEFQESLKGMIAYKAVQLAGISVRDDNFVKQLTEAAIQFGL